MGGNNGASIVYRAHNLCYTTLVHPDDVTGLPPEQTTEVLRPKANMKSHFVKPGLRKGILPSILAALIEARASTRAALKEASDPGQLLMEKEHRCKPLPTCAKQPQGRQMCPCVCETKAGNCA